MGNGVAHLDLLGILDTADNVAHLARRELGGGYHVHLEHAHLVGCVLHARVEELHLIPLAYHAILYLTESDNTAKRVEERVKDKGLQRSLGIARGCGDALYHGLEYLVDTLARLARRTDDVCAVAAYQVYYFVFYLIGHGAGHVYLVNDWYYLQVMVDGHVQVGDGLSLHALRSIDHQQRALARGDAARHLV